MQEKNNINKKKTTKNSCPKDAGVDEIIVTREKQERRAVPTKRREEKTPLSKRGKQHPTEAR